MFTKISQFRKTLSDEFENVMKTGVDGTASPTSRASTPGARPGRSAGDRSKGDAKGPVGTLRDNADILSAETPDPETLVVDAETHEEIGQETKPLEEGEAAEKQPGSGDETPDKDTKVTEDVKETKDIKKNDTKESDTKDEKPVAKEGEKEDGKEGSKAETAASIKSADDAATQVPVSGQMVVVDGYTVPKEVAPKLRKFKKYEAKYPKLVEAYRLEKQKSQLISIFERVLQEHTPATSISDTQTLIEYLSNLTLQSSMQNEELRNMAKKAAETEEAHRQEVKTLTDKFSTEKSELEDSLQVLKIEKESLLEKVKQLEKSAADTESSKEDSEKHTQLLADYEAVKSSAETEKAARERLEEQVLELETTKSELETKLKDAAESSSASELDTANTALETLRAEREELEKEAAAKQNASETQIAALESKVDELGTEVAALTSKLAETQTELDSSLCKHEQQSKDTREDFVKQLDSEKSKAEALEKKLTSVESILEETEGKLEKREQNVKVLSSTLKALRSKVDEKISAIKALEETSEAAAQETAAAKKQLATREDEWATEKKQLQQQVDALESSHSGPVSPTVGPPKKGAKNKKKKKNGKAVQPAAEPADDTDTDAPVKVTEHVPVAADSADSDSKLADLQAANDKLQEEVTSLQSRATQLESDLDKKVYSEQKLKDRLNTQIEEVSNLREMLTETGQDLVHAQEGFKAKEKRLRADVAELETHKSGLETKLAEHVARVEELVAENGELQAGESREQEVSRLSAAVDELQKEKKRLEEKVESLEAELETVKEKAAEDVAAVKQQSEKDVADAKKQAEKDVSDAKKQAEKDVADAKAQAASSREQDQSTWESRLKAAEQEARANTNLAQERFKEISQHEKTIKRLQTSLKEVAGKAESLQVFKEQAARRADEVAELQKSERALRTEISQLASIVSEKEDGLEALRAQTAALEAAQKKGDGRIATLRQNIQRVEGERKQLAERNGQLTAELGRLEQDADRQAATRGAWETERAKLVQEAAKLRAELDAETAQRQSSGNVVESLRKQHEEMSVQLMASTARLDAMEEELSQTHRHLQERISESATMRRLLADSEGTQNSKLQECLEKIQELRDERDALETEAAQLSKRRGREVDVLKQRVRDLESALGLAQEDKARCLRDVAALRASRTHADDELVASAAEAAAGERVLAQLRESLGKSEQALRQCTRANNNLKKMLEEGQSRIDKLHANQHTLNADIRALQLERQKLKEQLAGQATEPEQAPAKERKGQHSRTPSLSSLSLQKLGQGPPNIAYIKNVLLGFLEHKEQRQQLLPVVANLLDFETEDEKRFWTAINTR